VKCHLNLQKVHSGLHYLLIIWYVQAEEVRPLDLCGNNFVQCRKSGQILLHCGQTLDGVHNDKKDNIQFQQLASPYASPRPGIVATAFSCMYIQLLVMMNHHRYCIIVHCNIYSASTRSYSVHITIELLYYSTSLGYNIVHVCEELCCFSEINCHRRLG